MLAASLTLAALLLQQDSRPACSTAPSWATSFAPNLADSARLFRGTFTRDGQTLYYFRKVTLTEEDYRILVSRKTATGWSTGERLDLGGDVSDLYPSVSPDGKRIVFASYRPAPGDTMSHKNAYLWYAEKKGTGWGEPKFIAPAARFGSYHSGPIIDGNYNITFGRTSPDWRSRAAMITRWDGKSYRPAEVQSDDPGALWKDWRPGEYYVWGGQLTPSRDIAILDISPIDRAGRRGGAQVWISLKQGQDWSEPVPAGGGVNRAGSWTNFVNVTPDGCAVLYIRNFTQFETVSLEALVGPARSRAGEVAVNEIPGFTGTWRGAYVQAGAVQLVDAEIIRQGDTTRIATVTPDWPQRPPRFAVITRDSLMKYRWTTPFGQAVMSLDGRHGELTGTITGSDNPPITLTLKRVLASFRPAITREEVSVVSEGVTLKGTYVRPTDVPVRTAIVIVPGRGCVTRGGGQRLLEALAPYGVAGISFDKRGMGQSGGNCRFGTIDQFTSDYLAQLDFLSRKVNRDSVKVGFLGSSAGGWTSVRAAARSTTPVDFIVMVAGPSVSVESQQRDNARYITTRLKFTPSQQQQAMRYLDLMFAKGNQEARYREMQQIVKWSRDVGFADQFYDESDIPSSVAAVDSLWVTLNDYDPTPDLRRLKLPMLAFYGEQDEVVPPKENVTALRRAAAANPDLRARIIVVPDGDHGMGVAGGVTRIGEGVETHRFDRMSAVYLEHLVGFLNEQARSR